MGEKEILLTTGEKVHSGQKSWVLGPQMKDGSGGEGEIFELVGEDGFVAKIFKFRESNSLRFAKLEYMVRDAGKNLKHSKWVTWPLNVLYDGNQNPVGYRMRKCDGKSVSAGFFSRGARETTFQNWQCRWNMTDLLEACIHMMNGFQELHRNGILMADVNAGNVLFDARKNAYLVDTDSYQIHEKYMCLVGSEEYLSPEYWERSKGDYRVKRTLPDEYYAITVLLFQILTAGENPYQNRKGIEGFFPYHITFTGEEEIPEWYADTEQGEIRNNILRDEYQPESRRIWNVLPHAMKTTFFKTFVPEAWTEEDGEEFNSPRRWIALLNKYKKRIESGKSANDLWPGQDKAIENEDGEMIFGIKDVCESCGAEFDRRIIRNPVTGQRELKKFCDICEKMNTQEIQFVCLSCGTPVRMLKSIYELDVLQGRTLQGDFSDYHKCPTCIGKAEREKNKRAQRDYFLEQMEAQGIYKATVSVRFSDLKKAGYMDPVQQPEPESEYERIMAKYRPVEPIIPSEREAAVCCLMDRICSVIGNFRLYEEQFRKDYTAAVESDKLQWGYQFPDGFLMQSIHFFYWEERTDNKIWKTVYMYVVKG